MDRKDAIKIIVTDAFFLACIVAGCTELNREAKLHPGNGYVTYECTPAGMREMGTAACEHAWDDDNRWRPW
jgi:hypothetical protein